MAATDYLANLRNQAFANGTAYQGPATYYAELCTTAGTRETPGTPSGLGRVAIPVADLTLDGFGNAVNNATVAWDIAAADAGPQVYVELWDDPAAGNRHTFDPLVYDASVGPPTVVAGQIVQFLPGQLTISEI